MMGAFKEVVRLSHKYEQNMKAWAAHRAGERHIGKETALGKMYSWGSRDTAEGFSGFFCSELATRAGWRHRSQCRGWRWGWGVCKETEQRDEDGQASARPKTGKQEPSTVLDVNRSPSVSSTHTLCLHFCDLLST